VISNGAIACTTPGDRFDKITTSSGPGQLSISGLNEERVISSFFAELRRRRVIRVIALYAIVGWIVIEVASTVLPGLNLPDWT
jgi:hypothetical protein